MDFTNSNKLRENFHKLIPGGAHTYSKGDDSFPLNAPFIKRGYGARVEDIDGNEFIDWGMGLTSVILGHAYKEVIEVVKNELNNGTNFIRPSYIEAEFAEQFIEQIPSAEMVKFGKNGSDATNAAIRLSRAYTGKEVVLRCKSQPFFSINDWFIGDTHMDRGVPKCIKKLTDGFYYNNISSLEEAIDRNYGNVACVIMEAASTEEPKEGFLEKVKEICEKNGIVLIFDEVVSGFRFHPKGAQYLYGVTPHLSTFGKAMANGFSISALAGKKEIMEVGGILHKEKRVFLLSTTYGGETHHIRAAQKTMEILNRNDYEVTKYIWNTGRKVKKFYNSLSKEMGIEFYTKVEGIDCRPYLIFKDENGNNPYLRTIFMEEMIKNGVLLQSFNPSFSHKEEELQITFKAIKHSLIKLKEIIESKRYLDYSGEYIVKPVFRKYN